MSGDSKSDFDLFHAELRFAETVWVVFSPDRTLIGHGCQVKRGRR